MDQMGLNGTNAACETIEYFSEEDEIETIAIRAELEGSWAGIVQARLHRYTMKCGDLRLAIAPTLLPLLVL